MALSPLPFGSGHLATLAVDARQQKNIIQCGFNGRLLGKANFFMDLAIKMCLNIFINYNLTHPYPKPYFECIESGSCIL